MAPLLALDRVVGGYGRTVSVRGVSLRCDRGECVRVAGPNGSGKSTLLRLAAGVTAPQRGSVTRAAVTRLGYAPSNFTVAGELTGAGYVAHVSRLRKVPAPAGRREATELARRFGLSPGLDTGIGRLSAGNRQIVNLIQALAGRPDLLILDEPLANLSEAVVEAVLSLLADLRDRGVGLIVADHSDRAFSGQRVLHLHDGALAPPPSAATGGPEAELVVTDHAGATVSRVVGPVVGREADFLREGDVVRGWHASP